MGVMMKMKMSGTLARRAPDASDFRGSFLFLVVSTTVAAHHGVTAIATMTITAVIVIAAVIVSAVTAAISSTVTSYMDGNNLGAVVHLVLTSTMVHWNRDRDGNCVNEEESVVS